MKTYHILIIALLTLGLAEVGCHKSPKVIIGHASIPTAPEQLKLNWPLGRYGIQSFDMKITQEMTVPGMPQPMKQEMGFGQQTSLTVTKELDGGKRDVEMEYLNTKMSMSMAGRTMIDYDSSKKPTKPNDPAIAAMGKMTGAKIQFILDASNRVESVEGIEDLQSRMEGVTKNDQTGMMKSLLSADTLKQMMDHAANLPDKAVQPGDSWPVHHEFAMGPLGTMVMDFTNTLDGWEKRNNRWCAKIGVEGTIKTKPGDNADSIMKGMKIAVSDGTTSGETWFDLDMGMFVDTTMNQDMKLAITVPTGNPNKKTKKNAPAATQTINSDMHQVLKTTFELK